ncbi:MAG: hypothetical protein ACPGED_01075 [Flavobacteriales bacterium]
MKNTHKVFAVIGAFVMLFMASCLNEDNKIPENCYDGILNNLEERIDCGGPCPACDPCENGQIDFLLGETWVDCGGECGPCDPAFNGIQDGDETGIDCGGSTGVACGSLCDDGLLNGNEEGIDCNGDCETVCPTCDDLIMNQDEIGIDCGGTICDPCSEGGDCTDGTIDGDELYIDCGGTHCAPCEEFINYSVGPDDIPSLTMTGNYNAGTGVITLHGETGTSAEIDIVLLEPLSSWAAWVPTDGSFNVAMGADPSEGELAYTGFGVPTSTVFGGSGIVSIQYVDVTTNMFIVGTFNGSCNTADESDGVNISSGTFFILLDD